MPRATQPFLRRCIRFVLALVIIAVASFLDWPGRHLGWLVPSASAFTTSSNEKSGSPLAVVLPGTVSFAAQNFSVKEGDGFATITMTRTGGSDNQVVAKVSLTDVTTSPADYRYAPGSLDTSFNPGTGADGVVYATALQPDGKIIIGGSFSNFNGVSANRIARLNPNGFPDLTFNPGGSGVANSPGGVVGSVWAVAIQADGKILIGGYFKTYNGTPRNSIARLNADGSLDTSFDPASGPAPDSALTKIIVQPDGKIIIGGGFTSFNGTSRNHIARLNVDGSLDTTFDPGTGSNGGLSDVALQVDGKIIIGGFFTNYNGNGSDSF